MNRVTIKDVAELAGVSTATVSYVLNDSGSVSEATADRVRQCVDQLGYRANSLAVAHRTGRSRTIGLALPDLSNPFCPEVAKGVHHAARAAGFAVVLLDAFAQSELEQEGIERFADRMPEGLVWIPVGEGSWTPADIGVPVVSIDAETDEFDLVRADVHTGGRLQGELIVANGHRCVGVVSGPDWSGTARTRRDGLVGALEGHVAIEWEYALPYSAEVDHELVDRMLDSDVTCIVTANDIQAIGILKALHRGGRRVPEDVSVIGFDDVPLAELMSPALTSVRLPIEEMGRSAVDLLLSRIDEPELETREVVLPVDLVERESFQSAMA